MQSHSKGGRGRKPEEGAGGKEDLHAAARSGDLPAVVAICSSNPLSVNSRDRHSRTPLHLAAWSGHTEIVTYLCKNKADVGAAAMDDMGAIHFAAQKGHLEVIKILVSHGVQIKIATRKGMTALHYAAQGSNLNLVKYLMKKGAKVDSKNKAGKTPVDLASSEEMRRALMERERDQVVSKDDLGEEGSEKRSGEATNEDQRNAKKPKVTLDHLLAAEDTQEDQENAD